MSSRISSRTCQQTFERHFFFFGKKSLLKVCIEVRFDKNANDNWDCSLARLKKFGVLQNASLLYYNRKGTKHTISRDVNHQPGQHYHIEFAKHNPVSGCVYTYPDIRISGYPDIFGAFTHVGSKRFRRLHVSRHPDALYAAYSLYVGEIRKCSFLVKLHAFKLSSIFPFFLLMFVGWTTKSKFCLVSSVIDYKTQH